MKVSHIKVLFLLKIVIEILRTVTVRVYIQTKCLFKKKKKGEQGSKTLEALWWKKWAREKSKLWPILEKTEPIAKRKNYHSMLM